MTNPTHAPIAEQIAVRRAFLGVQAATCLYAFMECDKARWIDADFDEVRAATLARLAEPSRTDDAFVFYAMMTEPLRGDIIARLTAA